MQIQLRSDQLTAEIKTAGAELVSLRDRALTEYIWQADPGIWARHAPVLFPIVGRLKSDQYCVGEDWYTLGQHGFARDLEFLIVGVSDNTCTLELSADTGTRQLFPFDFKLSISYTLEGKTLSAAYAVKNPSEEAIWFSLGAHPGFNCPLFADEHYEDYSLEFEKEHYRITALSNGLRTDVITSLALPERKLRLNARLFDNDALIFEGAQVNCVRLCSSSRGPLVQLNCDGWPFFGIWGMKGSERFVCLEPWFGIADHQDSKGRFLEKKGIVALNPGQTFEASYSIAILS